MGRPVREKPATAAERRAFERCFREHYPALLAFVLRRTAGRPLAEDITADTFSVAWRRRAYLPDPALPWLYATATKLLANQRRSRGAGQVNRRSISGCKR